MHAIIFISATNKLDLWYHLHNLIRNLITFIYHIFLIIHFNNIIILELFNQNIHLNNLNLISFTHAFSFLTRNIQSHLFITYFYTCTQSVSLINSHFERKTLSHYTCQSRLLLTDIIFFLSLKSLSLIFSQM